MRKLLNRLLLPAGYRIERVSRFRRELDRLMQNEPLRFVQIGANDGVRFDGLYSIVTNRQCSGLVIEPLPDLYQRLRANYADYPGIIPVNAAIHEHEGNLLLYRVRPGSIARYEGWATGIASFDREHLVRHGIAPEDVIAQDVPCVPLMALLARTTMLDANLLQMDTEGYDAAIIRMIDFAAFRPRIIKYEHKNMTTAERSEVTELLSRKGYQTATEAADTIAWRSQT